MHSGHEAYLPQLIILVALTCDVDNTAAAAPPPWCVVERVLQEIAVGNEVLVAICNSNPVNEGMFQLWHEGVQRANMK